MAKKHWWSEEDIKYLEKNYRKKSVDELAAKFGVTRNALIRKANKCGFTRRKITEKELEYMRKNVHKGNDFLAKKIKGFDIRYARYYHNLGTIIDSNENSLCLNELSRVLGVSNSMIDSFVKKGLRFSKAGNYTMFAIKDVCNFLENNIDLWDATKCEEWYFNKYDWFQEKLKQDSLKKRQKRWGEFYEVI